VHSVCFICIPKSIFIYFFDFLATRTMPHTNRKKKTSSTLTAKPQPNVVHTKRQQIEDQDGWTHVVDTPRKSAQVKQNEWMHAGDLERNGATYINRTLEEVTADLAYYQKQWESGEGCGVLREKLIGRKGRVEVGDVVCLGLGSLQSARREGRRASFTQLAALNTILEVLGKSICCFLGIGN
jgi:hypothetical protein